MRKILDQLPPNDPGLIYRCLTRFVLCINHFHIICFVSHYAHFVYEAKLFTNYPPASEAGLRLHMRGSPQTSSCIGFAMDFCSMFNFIYYFFGYSFSLGGSPSMRVFWRMLTYGSWIQERKEKFGERIAALQQLVSPYGKVMLVLNLHCFLYLGWLWRRSGYGHVRGALPCLCYFFNTVLVISVALM